jgi:hypothetical protein
MGETCKIEEYLSKKNKAFLGGLSSRRLFHNFLILVEFRQVMNLRITLESGIYFA